MIIGIYKITSPTKRVYIGQSIDIDKRWTDYISLHCKSQTRLYRSLKKHGVKNHKFEVLCQCDVKELNEMERFYQDAFCAINEHGLNCVLTKTDSRRVEISDETREKLSESSKNISDETREKIRTANIGKKLSEETKEKISASNKGRIMSEKTKEKISLANKGSFRSLDSKNKMRIAQKGRVISFETRKKMSESRKGRVISEETRNKISNSRKGIVFSQYQRSKLSASASKMVLHLETGVFFDSASSAADCFGFKRGNFMNMLSGNRNNKSNCIYV